MVFISRSQKRSLLSWHIDFTNYFLVHKTSLGTSNLICFHTISLWPTGKNCCGPPFENLCCRVLLLNLFTIAAKTLGTQVLQPIIAVWKWHPFFISLSTVTNLSEDFFLSFKILSHEFLSSWWWNRLRTFVSATNTLFQHIFYTIWVCPPAEKPWCGPVFPICVPRNFLKNISHCSATFF